MESFCRARNFNVLVAVVLISFCSCAQSATLGFGRPENLSELSDRIAGDLVKSYKEKRPGAAAEKRPIVVVGKNYFLDPHSEHIHAFSTYLSESLQSALEGTNFFDVARDKDAESRFALGGTYYLEKDRLVVHCRIRTADETTGDIVTAASASADMDAKHCAEAWFQPTVESKVRYLVTKIEEDSFNQLYFEKRRDVVVDRFAFGNKDDFPELSDYLVDYLKVFLSGSRLLTPVHASDLAKRRGERKRDIVPTPVEGASLASFAGANYAITGNYRLVDRDTLEIHADLASAGDKKILGSAAVRMPVSLINADWLKSPVEENKEAKKASQEFSSEKPSSAEPFTVKIFTSKGMSGTKFKKDENIVFAAAVSEDAYLRIYERTASGKIYQLYPNGFSGPDRKIEAGESVWIPGEGQPFEFKVRPPFGEEIVKVYASDRPLDELASIDAGGFKQIMASPAEIQEAHTRFALRNGVKLAQDKLVLFTSE